MIASNGEVVPALKGAPKSKAGLSLFLLEKGRTRAEWSESVVLSFSNKGGGGGGGGGGVQIC